MKYTTFLLSAGYFVSSVFSQANQAPIVSITGPLANTVYKAGSEAHITWTEPKVSIIPQIVLVQGPPTALQPVMTIAKDLDAQSRSCIWKIPSDLPSGSNYALELGVSPNIAYTGQFTIENNGGPLPSQNSTNSTSSSASGTVISLSPSTSIVFSSVASTVLPTSNSSVLVSATSVSSSKSFSSTLSTSGASITHSPNGTNNPHFASSASKHSRTSQFVVVLGVAIIAVVQQFF
ncbi:hypothetical protein BY458DRAFT_433208 [Sporodiniella umbellata]|nr:hypothetical protein BY458DRAFT_433208 [Sporodiniella umbellata]